MNLAADASLLVCLCYCSRALLDCPACLALFLSCFTSPCLALCAQPGLYPKHYYQYCYYYYTLKPNNSTHYCFPNCCYRVVKHTNQQNQDEIPCPLRVRSNVDDRSAALLKTKGHRFEGFWVSGASSSDGGAQSAKGYCSRQHAGVERSGNVSQVGNVAKRERESAAPGKGPTQ